MRIYIKKILLRFVYIIFLILSQGALADFHEVNLQECFQLALQRSATVAISVDQIDQTDAQIKQARAGYMPVLSLQATTSQQAESTNTLAKSLSATTQTSSNINLSQNLFQGFKDLATVKQRTYMKLGNEYAKKIAVQQLYKDVAQSFYSLLLYQSDILLYKDQMTSTHQRRQELNAAKKSGRARDSDILIADSSIASIEAAISRTEGLSVTYQESFTFLTGLDKNTKLINNTLLPTQIENSSQWLNTIEQRADIQQSKNYLLAADQAIKASEAGYYPVLGLVANYYLSRPNGIYQGVDWDAGLVLSFPLFSGGLTKALVFEATMIRHTKELNLHLTEDLAKQTVVALVGTVQADFDQLLKLQNAADLSHKSYDLVHRDNHLGVATNTDVLTALQNWQESKRNLERTRITATYDYIRLMIETSQAGFTEPQGTSQPLGQKHE